MAHEHVTAVGLVDTNEAVTRPVRSDATLGCVIVTPVAGVTVRTHWPAANPCTASPRSSLMSQYTAHDATPSSSNVSTEVEVVDRLALM
jgi:hypothetical protein